MPLAIGFAVETTLNGEFERVTDGDEGDDGDDGDTGTGAGMNDVGRDACSREDVEAVGETTCQMRMIEIFKSCLRGGRVCVITKGTRYVSGFRLRRNGMSCGMFPCS